MSLPPEVQPLIDRLRVLLGLPACQLQVNIDKAGVVQGVQAMMTFSREKGNGDPTCCGAPMRFVLASNAFVCMKCQRRIDNPQPMAEY